METKMNPVSEIMQLYSLKFLRKELKKYKKRGNPEDGDIIAWMHQREKELRLIELISRS